MAAWFEGEGFTIDDGGIWATSARGDVYKVHGFPAMPLELVESQQQDGSERAYVRMRFMRGGASAKIVERTLPLGEATGGWGKDHPMVEAGWPAPTGASRDKVSKAIEAALKKVPEVESFGFCGWVDGCREHVRPGSPIYTGSLSAPAVALSGDFHLWRDTLEHMATTSPLCAFAIASAFASYLRGAIDMPHQQGHFLHLWGPKERGKSTILAAVVSIQGNPEKGAGGMLIGRSTDTHHEKAFAAGNHGFIAVDEADDMMRDRDADTLMFLANGIGKGRGSRDGGQQKSVSWQTTIITSGNYSFSELIRGDIKEGATGSRMFEAHIDDDTLHTFRAPLDAINKWSAVLMRNYGHGYPRAVEAIKEGRGYWQKAYDDALADLTTDDALRHFREEKRLGQFLALSTVGAELMGQVLGAKAGHAAARAIAIMREMHTLGDMETGKAWTDAQAKIQTVREFARASQGLFLWEGYAWEEPRPGNTPEEGQKNAARYLSEEAGKRGALGRIITYRPMLHSLDFEGEIELYRNGEEAMQKRHSLAISELKDAARFLGLAREDKKLGKAKAVAVMGGKTRCFSMFLRDVAQATPPEPVALPFGKNAGKFTNETASDWLASLPSMEGAEGPDLLEDSGIRDEDIPL